MANLLDNSAALEELLQTLTIKSSKINITWRFNDTLNDSPLSTEEAPVLFTSNGTVYSGIAYTIDSDATYLTYLTSDGSRTSVCTITPDLGATWADEAYKTIIVHEAITDEALLAWLTSNATLLSDSATKLAEITYDSTYKTLTITTL